MRIAVAPGARFHLSEAVLTALHDMAVALAARTGFRVPSAMLRERLHGVGGFMVTDQRIYPGEARIQAYVFELRARKQTPPDDLDAQPLLRYSDRPLYTISDDDVSLRPLTTQDVIAGTKLGYALYDRGIRGAACGLPSDVDPLYAPFEQLLIGLRYGRCGGYSSHAFTPWHMRYVAHIFQVLGWDFGVSVWMPSPFRLEGNELEIALALEGTYTSLGVGSMPLMGITAPMNELQTWAQGLAETLGAAAILQAAFPGITIDIYPHPKPADMTTGQYGVGTPEWNFMDALKMEILPFYGLRPPWGKGASIGAILPGPQATLERTAQYLTGYLHGYRVFDEAGIMAGGEVYSSVQLLFDLEAMEWVARYGRGTHLDNDTVDLERWAEIAASETLFAEDAEEVAKLRDVYSRNSRLFPCTTVGQHLTLPRDALADAKAEIRRLIANHAYEPDAAIMREAEAIVAHARAHPPA